MTGEIGSNDRFVRGSPAVFTSVHGVFTSAAGRSGTGLMFRLSVSIPYRLVAIRRPSDSTVQCTAVQLRERKIPGRSYFYLPAVVLSRFSLFFIVNHHTWATQSAVVTQISDST